MLSLQSKEGTDHMAFHFPVRTYMTCLAAIALIFFGCQGTAAEKKAPIRAFVEFLKAAGIGDMDAMKQRTDEASWGQIEIWLPMLIFPEHANPPSAEEISGIDRFIGLFYQINIIDQSDTECRLSVIWAGTDAVIQYPSVSENPTIPPTARYSVILTRQLADSNDSEYTDWKVSAIGPDR